MSIPETKQKKTTLIISIYRLNINGFVQFVAYKKNNDKTASALRKLN